MCCSSVATMLLSTHCHYVCVVHVCQNSAHCSLCAANIWYNVTHYSLLGIAHVTLCCSLPMSCTYIVIYVLFMAMHILFILSRSIMCPIYWPSMQLQHQPSNGKFGMHWVQLSCSTELETIQEMKSVRTNHWQAIIIYHYLLNRSWFSN